jgi:hypothetical protein
MRTFTTRRIGAAVALVALLVQPLAAADRADKRELMKEARAAYYSLRRSGLDSFQVNITVNWDVVLKGQPTTAAGRESAMKLLNGLHFAAAFGADGKTVVTHRADTPAPNAQSQAGYDQIFGGMDQVITGFMDTYKPFMVGSPFPEVDAAYTLEDFNNGYRLTYKDDAKTAVMTLMTKAFVITETVVHAADFDSTIKPSFLATADGYVLAGYDGDYVPTMTKTGVVKLIGTIEHSFVNGLRMPKKLAFDSKVDGVPNATELTFTDYIIQKK